MTKEEEFHLNNKINFLLVEVENLKKRIEKLEKKRKGK